MAEGMITEEILKDQFQNLVRQAIKAEELSEKSQDFLHDNKLIKKKKKTLQLE